MCINIYKYIAIYGEYFVMNLHASIYGKPDKPVPYIRVSQKQSWSVSLG